MEIIGYTGITRKPNTVSLIKGSGETIEVTLKEPTSKTDPVFIIAGHNNVTYTEFWWNGVYYYVTNIKYVTSTVREYECHADVLTTKAKEIKTKGNVLWGRSSPLSSTVFDKQAVSSQLDPMMKTHTIHETKTENFDMFDGESANLTKVTYAIRFTTSTASTLYSVNGNMGGTVTLLVDFDTISALISKMYTSPYGIWNNTSGTEPEGYQKTATVFPSDFIISVKMYPILFSNFSKLQTQTYKIGWTTWSITGVPMAGNAFYGPLGYTKQPTMYRYKYGIVPVPLISDTSKYPASWFTNFVSCKVNFDLFGVVDIPPEMIYKYSTSSTGQAYEYGYLSYTLYYLILIDFNTGAGTLLISPTAFTSTDNSNNPAIISIDATVGIDLPIQQVTTTLGTSSANMVASMAGAAQGSNYMQSINAGAQIIGALGTALFKGNTASVTNISTGSGKLPSGMHSVSISYTRPVTTPSEYSQFIGRPINGFCEPNGYSTALYANISTEWPESLRTELMQKLEAGVYVE